MRFPQTKFQSLVCVPVSFWLKISPTTTGVSNKYPISIYQIYKCIVRVQWTKKQSSTCEIFPYQLLTGSKNIQGKWPRQLPVDCTFINECTNLPSLDKFRWQKRNCLNWSIDRRVMLNYKRSICNEEKYLWLWITSHTSFFLLRPKY